jgi:hypothetical protein
MRLSKYKNAFRISARNASPNVLTKSQVYVPEFHLAARPSNSFFAFRFSLSAFNLIR